MKASGSMSWVEKGAKNFIGFSSKPKIPPLVVASYELCCHRSGHLGFSSHRMNALVRQNTGYPRPDFCRDRPFLFHEGRTFLMIRRTDKGKLPWFPEPESNPETPVTPFWHMPFEYKVGIRGAKNWLKMAFYCQEKLNPGGKNDWNWCKNSKNKWLEKVKKPQCL